MAAIVAFFNQMPALVLSFQIYWFREFSDGFPMNTTPLHIASFFGVTDLLRILLRTELANGLGNLASRTLTMIQQYRGGVIPPSDGDPAIETAAATKEPALVPT